MVIDTPKGAMSKKYPIKDIVESFNFLSIISSYNGIKLNLYDDYYKNIHGEDVYNIKFIVESEFCSHKYTLSSWIISFFNKDLTYKIECKDNSFFLFRNSWEIINHRFFNEFSDVSIVEDGKTTIYEKGAPGFDKACKIAGRDRDAILIDLEIKVPALTDFIRFVRVDDSLLYGRLIR